MAITINGDSGISGVNGSAATPALQGTDTNTGISFGTDEVNINTGGTTRAKVDSSGRLLVGTSTARSPNSVSAALQLESTGIDGSSIALTTNSSASPGSCPYLVFSRTGGSSNGSNTIVSSGDTLGSIDFIGADGSDVNNLAARISAQVDTTPGNNDMPGRLVFSTTADSASSPTERLRIGSNGNVTLNGGNLVLSNGAGIDFSATANSSGTMTSELLDDYEEGTWTPTLSGSGGGSGQTYSVRNGFYTKVGRLVHLSLEIVLTNKGTITDYPIITGMPFNRNPYDAERTTALVYYYNLATSVYNVTLIHDGNTQAFFQKITGTATNPQLFATGGTDIANNSRFIITWSYQADY